MIALKEAGYQGVRKGQLVIHAMDAFAGAVGVSDSDGKCTPEYIVCNPRQPWYAPTYFASALRVAAQTRFIEVECQAVRERAPRLRYPDFGSLQLPVPTASEQTAIVRYLNHVDGCIRRYIGAKRKLIALLDEQKQAIIHQVVTRGLDPNVRFKPSGVEWLGDVPEHWDVVANRWLFRETTRPYTGGDERQLSLSQQDGVIETERMKERSLRAATYDNFKICVPGDLVANRFKAHLGVFFETILRGIVTFHYGVFCPIKRLRTKFFELLFHTSPYRAIFAGASNGMTVGLQNLSNQRFYAVKAIVPPLVEQDAILDVVARESKYFNVLIGRARREVDLLREYRIRLIADVVTGKLDVREAAARLPDELDEPEPLDDIDAPAEDDDEAALDEASEEADA